MERCAVIDISSTSISMIVARIEGTSVDILDRQRRHVSLLGYLDGQTLSPRGMERLMATLKDLKDTCVALAVDTCHLIGTAALRMVDNIDEICSVIVADTGLSPVILTGEEEAYCGYVANRSYASYPQAVMVDIGGASIEISSLSSHEGAEDTMLSLAFGTVTLRQAFVNGMQPDTHEAKEIKRYVRAILEDAGLPGSGTFRTVVLVGATMRSLYEVYDDLWGKDGVTPGALDYKAIKKLARHLVKSPDRSRIILKAAPEKIHVLVISALIVREIMRRFKPETILLSDSGVKEGWLISQNRGETADPSMGVQIDARLYDGEGKGYGGKKA